MEMTMGRAMDAMRGRMGFSFINVSFIFFIPFFFGSPAAVKKPHICRRQVCGEKWLCQKNPHQNFSGMFFAI